MFQKIFYIKIFLTLKSDAWFIADYEVKRVSKGRLLNDWKFRKKKAQRLNKYFAGIS